MRIKIVILAGGFATRLWPLTKRKAKGLLDYKGKPVLTYLIKELEKVPNIIEVVVASNKLFYNQFLEWKKEIDSPLRIKVISNMAMKKEQRLGPFGDLNNALQKTSKDYDSVIIFATDYIYSNVDKFIKNFVKLNKPIMAVEKRSDSHQVKINGNKLISLKADRTGVKALPVTAFPKYSLAGLRKFLGRKIHLDSHYVSYLLNKKEPVFIDWSINAIPIEETEEIKKQYAEAMTEKRKKEKAGKIFRTSINDYSENLRHPIKMIQFSEIKNLNDTQLTGYHARLHDYWTIINDGHIIRGWTKSKIIQSHRMVVLQYPRRRIKHYWVNDLDRTIPDNKTENIPKKKEKEEIKKLLKRITKKLNDIAIYEKPDKKGDIPLSKPYSFKKPKNPKPIKELVKDSEWQQVRKGLIGKWKKEPTKCVDKLKKYLGPLNKTSWEKLKIVMNYLTGSGFRMGKIKHPDISKLRKEISNELKKRI